jgi:hypothetical protein
MSLADLLQWLCLGRKTGTLHLQNGRVRKQVYLHEGHLVSAGSNVSSERLGQFLLHHGRITEGDLRAALSAQAGDNRPLGEFFCEMGLIDKDGLIGILQLKAEETIYDLFLWDKGNFHFDDGALPHWSMTRIRLDLTGLIMEGVRRKDEMGLIRQRLPSTHVRLAVTERSSAVTGGEAFDRRLIELVQRGHTVAEICRQSRAPEFVLLKRLHDLIEQGLLEVAEDLSSRRQAPEDLPFDDCARLCRTALEDEDLTAVVESLASLRRQAGEAPDGTDEVARLEKAATELIYSTMISPDLMPKMKRSLDTLVTMNLGTEEGFVVSRIDGTTDIRSLVQISPVSEYDTLLIFRRLLDEDVIDLTGTADIQPRKD